MKKLFLLVAFIAAAFVQNSFAQNTSQSLQNPQLLTIYYGIKDALVSDNSALAGTKAVEFVKAFNGSDLKMIPQSDRDALLKDATHISESKDIKHQREHFASFSNNMFSLAKASKLTTQPVYQLYCPMKKTYWLSSEKTIKNPYFGSAMLTCGEVSKTL